MKKIVNKIYTKYMKKKGYNEYASRWIKSSFYQDFKRKDLKLSKKLWCWKRGFLSDKISYYGINEENYKEYLSDLEFYKLFPINNNYTKLIDDKLTLKYVLQPYNEYLPEYYYIIKNGNLQKIFDCEEIYKEDIDSLRKLLKNKKTLAIKLLEGEKGKGFLKFEEIEGKIYINNKEYSENDFKEFIKQLNGYIVTEYIHGNKEVEKIYDKSLNTIRIMYINDNGNAYINKALIRIGNSKSGTVDNVSQGGLFSIIDMETGRFEKGYRYENGKLIDVEKHPDTQEKIIGQIPYWDEIKNKICQIGKYLFELEYLGFDVAVTENGFKIIEINSFQGIDFFQIKYPLKGKNEKTKKYFDRKIGNKNGYSKIR